MHWNWILECVPQERQGGLLLGALPVMTEVMGSGNHLKLLHKQVRDLGTEMGMVVSCMMPDEMTGFGVNLVKFATHDDWRAEFGLGIITRLLPVDDCTADGMALEQLSAVLDEMEATMRRGLCVKVHCKAGKGRSWICVMCFLIRHRNMTIDAAATLVRAARPCVNPSREQVRFVEEFFQHDMRRRRQQQQS